MCGDGVSSSAQARARRVQWGARNATYVLICSLTTAQYAAHLSKVHDLPITLLPTASSTDIITRNEDDYCADYLEALLTDPTTAHRVPADRIERLYAEERFTHWGSGRDEDFPAGDLELILAVDRFDFAMVGVKMEYVGIAYVDVQTVHPPML